MVELAAIELKSKVILVLGSVCLIEVIQSQTLLNMDRDGNFSCYSKMHCLFLSFSNTISHSDQHCTEQSHPLPHPTPPPPTQVYGLANYHPSDEKF